jgi:hypothetical protein
MVDANGVKDPVTGSPIKCYDGDVASRRGVSRKRTAEAARRQKHTAEVLISLRPALVLQQFPPTLLIDADTHGHIVC